MLLSFAVFLVIEDSKKEAEIQRQDLKLIAALDNYRKELEVRENMCGKTFSFRGYEVTIDCQQPGKLEYTRTLIGRIPIAAPCHKYDLTEIARIPIKEKERNEEEGGNIVVCTSVNEFTVCQVPPAERIPIA